MGSMFFHNILIFGSLVVAGSCGTQRQAEVADKPAGPSQLLGITYRKSGGLAGMNEWVTISSDGHVQVSGRYTGEGDGQLTAEQRRALVTTFTGWDALKEEYLPDRPAPDGMTLYVRYGAKGVTVVEPAEVPGQFRSAATAIESAARGIATKK